MLASPGRFVIDHMGWQPCRKGIDSPGFRVVLECLDTGRCWVKLSGPNRFSDQDTLPYSDTLPFAQALIERAPNRVLWGSDWPHPNWFKPMPNDADLLDLLLDWAPDDAARHRILVDNPAELFGFGNPRTEGITNRRFAPSDGAKRSSSHAKVIPQKTTVGSCQPASRRRRALGSDSNGSL